MDRSTPIALVKTTYTRDAAGVQRKAESLRTVYANIQSVTASEFFEGGRNGLAPELRFTMFRYDYDGEPVVIHEGRRYAVYRTYNGLDDTIELYTEQKGGTNG